MGWMGLVGGALQGAGKGAADYFKSEIENENALERAQASIDMKLAAENKERVARSERVKAAREGIIGDTLARKGGSRSDLENDPGIWAKAGIQTGDLDIDKVVAMVAAERRDAIAARKLLLDEAKAEHRMQNDDLRLELLRAGLDLQNRRLDAMLSKVTANGASSSANTDWFNTIKKETGWEPEKILTYMATAKAPVPTEKKTVEDNGLGGKKEKVVTSGPAEQKPAAASGKPWERKW